MEGERATCEAMHAVAEREPIAGRRPGEESGSVVSTERRDAPADRDSLLEAALYGARKWMPPSSREIAASCAASMKERKERGCSPIAS